MILGTVELGLDYGINNTSGKPSSAEVYRILDTAWSYGVRELDTAAAYGDSEQIIGDYRRETGRLFKVDTKLMPSVGMSVDDVRRQLEHSLQVLGCGNANVLYLHRFELCKDTEIMVSLSALKADGLVRQVGVSIYEPAELDYIVRSVPAADVVQLPMNVLDSFRWRRDGLLQKAQDRGLRLLVRSVYLQGLLFKSADDPFVRKLGAGKYLSYFQERSRLANFSPAQFACCFVRSIPGVDDILMGCERTEQLADNLRILSNPTRFDERELEEIERFMSDIPAMAIDPRRWNQ